MSRIFIFLLLALISVCAHASDSTAFRPRSVVPRSSSIAFSWEKDDIIGTCSNQRCNELEGKFTRDIRGGAVRDTLSIALTGVVIFGIIERLTKTALASANISFPGQLGACVALFTILCAIDLVAPSASTAIFEFLTPAAGLLAKWLPIFFVPGLVLLPLSPGFGGPMDILKVIVTVVLGSVYTIITTLGGVIAVRNLQGKAPASSPESGTKKSATKATPAPAFSETQWQFCVRASLITGLVSAVTSTQTKSKLARPFQTLFLGSVTITSYIFGTRLPSEFSKIVHPLVTSALVTLVVIRGLAAITGREFLETLATFKRGTLDPMEAGVADYFMYILGPSVVSLGITVYSRKNLLFENLPMVLTAMIISSVGGLYGTAGFVRLVQLGGMNGSLVRLSTLARNVTTALAIALTQMIGGDVSIIAVVVVMTGVLGATFGKTFLNALGIKDPICRGLGIGSSSQGLGVASMADEPEAFPFAAISMVLTAVAATSIASIPATKNALIRLASGSSS